MLECWGVGGEAGKACSAEDVREARRLLRGLKEEHCFQTPLARLLQQSGLNTAGVGRLNLALCLRRRKPDVLCEGI